MADQGYKAIHIDEMPEPEYEKQPGDTDWRPIRIHFGITSFGANAFTAQKGDTVVIEHRETEDGVVSELDLLQFGSARSDGSDEHGGLLDVAHKNRRGIPRGALACK